MIWVSWRRQRTETLDHGRLLALLAALLVPTGHRDGIRVRPTTGSARASARTPGQARARPAIDVVQRAVRLAQQLHRVADARARDRSACCSRLRSSSSSSSGTHRLAWTQSVSRARWLAGKLGFAVAVALAASLVFTLLVTWWRAPIVRIDGPDGPERLRLRGHRRVRLHALRARACGRGRRRVAASGVPRSSSASSATSRCASSSTRGCGRGSSRRSRPPSTCWTTAPTSSGTPGCSTSIRATARATTCQIPFDLCGPPPAGGGKPPDIGNCLADHGVFMHATYLPASRFWALQGIETALFGGVAIRAARVRRLVDVPPRGLACRRLARARRWS